MNSEHKFRAWFPDLKLMLYEITLYPEGMIGIDADRFENALRSVNPLFHIFEDGVFLVDHENHIFDHLIPISHGDEWYYFGKDDFVVMEFFGLKDKNGKDIYTEDIIAISIDKRIPIQRPVVKRDMMDNEVIRNEVTGYVDVKGRALYKIIWEEWGCKYSGKFIMHKPFSIGQQLGYGDLFLHPDNESHKLNIEKIGNVYENSELTTK
jgi:hypothetical protein